MPHFIDETPAESGTREHRKLVLCFDGTGNVFNGNTSDTNIVKLYDKFDRKDPLQYHYYQSKQSFNPQKYQTDRKLNLTAGIGTYSINGGSLNKGPFGNIVSKISKSIDSGFATTFDSHVMAGYRFIMRYYKEGDKIYIFGFSRGAFTARFLARMIYTVGLLSEGNEEMIPFAYDLYQQYEQGLLDASEPEQQGCSNTTKPVNETHTSAETQPILPKGLHTDDCLEHDAQQLVKNKLNAFKTTFCRSKNADNSDIKVHFLGMFDCVSSVAVLDSPFGQAPKAVSVLGTAHHIRHAVAVDEHRVKFKAALLQQDQMQAGRTNEDIKEVWFPGNHGDVGGGWPAAPSSAGKKPQPQKSWWRRIFRSLNDPNASNPGTDPYQMSDIPLAWMIRELEILGDKDPASAIKWNSRKKGFKTHFFDKKKEAYNGVMHDTLRIGGGSSLFKVMLWNFMGKLICTLRYNT
jgi:uncharacterized protein (DUF2235 family)